MFMPMAMFFYILFYVSMPFNEERTEFKKMQPISPFIYWTSVFLFDALIHALYAYFMYTIHIWCDTHHIFEAKEYGKQSTANTFEHMYGINVIDFILRSDVPVHLPAVRT